MPNKAGMLLSKISRGATPPYATPHLLVRLSVCLSITTTTMIISVSYCSNILSHSKAVVPKVGGTIPGVPWDYLGALRGKGEMRGGGDGDGPL